MSYLECPFCGCYGDEKCADVQCRCHRQVAHQETPDEIYTLLLSRGVNEQECLRVARESGCKR